MNSKEFYEVVRETCRKMLYVSARLYEHTRNLDAVISHSPVSVSLGNLAQYLEQTAEELNEAFDKDCDSQLKQAKENTAAMLDAVMAGVVISKPKEEDT